MPVEMANANGRSSSIYNATMITLGRDPYLLPIDVLEDLFKVLPALRSGGTGPLGAAAHHVWISIRCFFTSRWCFSISYVDWIDSAVTEELVPLYLHVTLIITSLAHHPKLVVDGVLLEIVAAVHRRRSGPSTDQPANTKQERISRRTPTNQ